MPWFMILMWILLKAPEIYDLVKFILDLIRSIPNRKQRHEYDAKLRKLVKQRLDHGIQVSGDLERMKGEVEKILGR